LIRLPIPANSKVLVAPLNWGLGHATRSIPIIQSLLDNHCIVSIASDNDALALLRMEFPGLNYFNLPGYDIRYSYKSMAANMLFQLPKILGAFKKEKKEIDRLQKNQDWDCIISDGRYGVRGEKAQNIFISHQLQIQSWNPIAASIATLINKKLINKFDELWIPDEEKQLLSGNLSNANGIHKHRFIGVLSRMRPLRIPIKYDIAIVLSGPEPSRTYLEKKLISILEGVDKKIAFVRGVDDSNLASNFNDNMDVFGRLGSEQLNQIISASNLMISRAGYSSIMDLFALHKKAILIPTPGQTEQEYLAQYLDKNPLFTFLDEKEISQLSELLV